ncbi:hypothetical protein [Castellaniella sp.]|uniref:hypothetical protein n=1 Tax=Castellaniella sp. TaxID=1955812 RepID=UPI003C737622
MMRPRQVVTWWLGALLSLSGPVSAQPWDPARTVAQPGWVWAGLQRLDLPQVRLSVQSFQAPVPPPEAARRLAAGAGRRLTRLQWVGDMLLLSGGRGTEHWLAQLQPQAAGTVGLVSRLEPAVSTAVRFDPAVLAPPGSRRVLQVQGRAAADPASLSSFDCPGTLVQVVVAVRRALLAAGWSVAEAPAGAAGHDAASAAVPLPTDWRHPGDGRLSVHLHARRQSVALTFWHHPQEPS